MRDQGFIVWVVLGAVLLVVLNLPLSVSRNAKAALREGIAPLQAAVAGVSRKAKETLESVRGIGEVVDENRNMKAEIVRLRDVVRHLKVLETDNIAVREQLQFAKRSERKLIPCEVIARDISGWWQTVRLGKGSADGIARNMAVVTTDGLAGKTIAVSPRTCDVLLLSDPSCKVSARIYRTGLYGIVSGRGASVKGQVVCLMDFINKEKPVRAGDEVVTSGLGGVYPKGLLIGYVEEVTEDASGLYRQARVIPRADLGALDYVFVVAEESDPISELLRKKGLSGGDEL